MKTQKLKIFIGFSFLLLCLSILPLSTCSRHRYLDLPSIEVTDEPAKVSAPIEQSSVEEQIPSISAKENSTNQKVEYGKASYYADKFQGKRTASGELYDRNRLTAAHRTLPFGTLCRVTNLTSKKSVTVRINDRGPHVKGRIIDLSYEAMRLIDGLSAGEIEVMVKVLE